jgi:4-hydroxybenzoyl-CoA thioesterase
MKGLKMAVFSMDMQVSFGDCDPAGIVFYPNFFVWIDRCFHALLRERLGGHAHLCRELGAQGIGLMEAGMNFRAPATEGDLLHIRLDAIDWADKSFAITYRAHAGERLIFGATETRGIFLRRGDGRLQAGDVAGLQARFSALAR